MSVCAAKRCQLQGGPWVEVHDRQALQSAAALCKTVSVLRLLAVAGGFSPENEDGI